MNWDKAVNGLLPVIIIDDATGDVLMQGYMNEDSLARTQAQQKVWFWSRSKGRLWLKGETSGHFLHVVSMAEDCDQDTLLIRVIPEGPTCHTGARTCFGEGQGGIFTQLDNVLAERAAAVAEGGTDLLSMSYTQLLMMSNNRMAKKIGEETAEFLMAFAATVPGEEPPPEETLQALVEEASDVIFHLAVALHSRGVLLADVQRELANRQKL